MFIFLMLLYLCANTAARILVRVFTKNTNLNSYVASFVLTVPAYIAMLVFSLLTYGNILTGVTPILIAMLAAHAAALVYFAKLSVQAQKHVETAPFMVLRQVFVPVSVLASTIFLNESLAPLQLIGMTLILLGTYVIASNGRTTALKHIGRYEFMVLVYGCFLGLSIVFSRFIQEQASLGLLLVLGGALETIFSGIAAAKNTGTSSRITRKELLLACLIGLFSAMHIVAFFLASDLVDNVSVVSTLSSLRIVTIFIASYFFLHEKSYFRVKVAGSILATIGVLLV